jgi:hypothetical protein
VRINARIPNVKYASAIGTKKKLYAAGTPMKDAAKDPGCWYARNMRKPKTTSIMPIMTCNVASIVALAGRAVVAGVRNAIRNPETPAMVVVKKPSQTY